MQSTALCLLCLVLYGTVSGFLLRPFIGPARWPSSCQATSRFLNLGKRPKTAVPPIQKEAKIVDVPAVSNVIDDQRHMVEEPTILLPGVPLELRYKDSVLFGNFLSQRAGTSILVQTASGDELVLDSTQVISSWDMDPHPADTQQWAQTASEAVDILAKLSARKADLKEFWSLTLRLGLPVDSLDLGIYIFQEHAFLPWIDSSLPSRDIYELSPAQRYAAAVLLGNDIVHFKRRPSRCTNIASASDILTSSAESEVSSTFPVSVIEGGYKPLDESIVGHKETDLFAQYYAHRCNDTVIACLPSVNRNLRALEIYALSGATNTVVKPILNRLFPGMEQTPQLASILLQQMKITAVHRKQDVVRPSLVPWSNATKAAANRLYDMMAEYRQELREGGVTKFNKRGGFYGGFEFRHHAHPALCFDAKDTTFFDDAISLSPETGELLIHVTDVTGPFFRANDSGRQLEQEARDRFESIYLPAGASHMLPERALQCLKLSSDMPNPCVTVAVAVDFATGKISKTRVMTSTINPITHIRMDQAEDILSSSATECEKKYKQYSAQTIADIQGLHVLCERMIEKQPWLKGKQYYTQQKLDKKKGIMREIKPTPLTQTIVNTALTLYGNASHWFCVERNVPVPLVFENRDANDRTRVKRFASHPLRSWIAQQQQRQIVAFMNYCNPLTADQCAKAVAYHNSKRRETTSSLIKGKAQHSLQALQLHCATVFQATGKMPEFEAVGIGMGGMVRILPYGLQGKFTSTVAMGEKVRVQVRKLDIQSRMIVLDPYGAEQDEESRRLQFGVQRAGQKPNLLQ